jgi:hypothetical protein
MDVKLTNRPLTCVSLFFFPLLKQQIAAAHHRVECIHTFGGVGNFFTEFVPLKSILGLKKEKFDIDEAVATLRCWLHL